VPPVPGPILGQGRLRERALLERLMDTVVRTLAAKAHRRGHAKALPRPLAVTDSRHTGFRRTRHDFRTRRASRLLRDALGPVMDTDAASTPLGLVAASWLALEHVLPASRALARDLGDLPGMNGFLWWTLTNAVEIAAADSRSGGIASCHPAVRDLVALAGYGCFVRQTPWVLLTDLWEHWPEHHDACGLKARVRDWFEDQRYDPASPVTGNPVLDQLLIAITRSGLASVENTGRGPVISFWHLSQRDFHAARC
jgi:hypothetical protein